MKSSALITAVAYAIIGIWMWLEYPDCAPGHIAVFAPTMTLWACAQGYYTAAPKTR
jgi:hypothetical protein